MASDPAVTLSDGRVNLEPLAVDPDPRGLSLRWRVYRLSTRTELGVVHLESDHSDEPPIRARLRIEAEERADTATIRSLAQAVRLTCRWAFAALNLEVITWLGPTEPTARAVVSEAGFRVHPIPHRAALAGSAGSIDAWYADLTPTDTLDLTRRPLTAREHHVLTGMARGRSNQQIATDLGISENTVKNHVRSILEVLQAPSRTAAVIDALRTGLVSMEFDSH